VSDEDTQFGADLVEAMAEAAAWKRGDIALAVREIDPMPPERIRAIRRAAAKSARDFEQKYHVPARTLEGWEQGRRKPDLTARILLTVIERDPQAVARALTGEAS
jgi:putative transcriptional regulator